MGHAKRGSERVLESRHLIALFLGVVLLCCVFFTLGYVMGTTQYGNTPVEAAGAPKKIHPEAHNSQAAQPKPAAATEWDFYTEKKTTDVPLKPGVKATQASPSSAGANNGWEGQPLNSSSGAPAIVGDASSRASTPPKTLPRTTAVPSSPKHEAPARSAKPKVSRPEPLPARFRAPQISRRAVVLQITAVRHQNDALKLADKLQRRGFPAFVVESTKGGFYRVEVGPFETKSIGEKAKKSLQREGYRPIYRR